MSNIYDQFIQKEAQTTGITPAKNVYDDLIAKEDSDAQDRLASTLATTVGTDPEKAVKAFKLGKTVGVPHDVAGRNLPEVEKIAQMRELMDNARKSPVLRQQLTDPVFAGMAYKESTSLTGMERSISNIKQFFNDAVIPTPARSYSAYQQGTGGMYEWLGDALGWDGMSQMGKAMGAEARMVDKQIQAEHPMEAGSWTDTTASALQSIGLQLPFMATGALFNTANSATAATLGLMGMSTGGQTYSERRDKGFSPFASGLSAAWDASIEVGTEVMPTKAVFDLFKPTIKKTLAQTILKATEYYGEELVGESLATFFQDANAKFMDKPDMSLQDRINKIGDYITSGEAIDNWVTTLKTTAMQSTIMGGAGIGMNRLQQNKLEKQQRQHNLVMEALVAAETSRLNEQSPETFVEYAQKVAEQNGVESVYFQADKLVNAALQNGVPEHQIPAYLAQYGVTADQIQEAAHTNGLLALNMGNFLSNFKNDQVLQSLQNDFLVDVNGTALSETENGVKLDIEQMKHINELYTQDQANKLDHNDLSAWEDAILNDPALKGKVAKEHLLPLTARANLLSSLTGLPAIEHLNDMLAPTGIQAMKFKDFQRQRQEDAGMDVTILNAIRTGKGIPTESQAYGPSLVDFIRNKGGIKDQGGELAAMDAHAATRQAFKKNFVSDNGVNQDTARELAVEAGYLPADATVSDFLDAIGSELSGTPKYSPSNRNAAEADKLEKITETKAMFEMAGIDPTGDIEEILQKLADMQTAEEVLPFQRDKRKALYQSPLTNQSGGVQYNQTGEGGNNARYNAAAGQDGRLGKSKIGHLEAATDVAGRSYIASPDDARDSEVRAGEAARLKEFAEQNGLMLDAAPMMAQVFEDGISGTDNFVYYADGAYIKINKFKHAGTFTDLFRNIALHNLHFKEAPYTFEGFTEAEGELRPVFSQEGFVNELKNDPKKMEQLAAEALVKQGYTRIDGEFGFVSTAKFVKGDVEISDINSKNVAYQDGQVLFFDPVIKIRPGAGSGKNIVTLFQSSSVDEYAGEHRPPGRDDGAPLYDLTGNGIYPDDIYLSNGLRYYGTGQDVADRESLSVILSAKNKPNAKIIIYRAVPKVESNAQQIARLESEKYAYMKRGKIPKNSDFTNGSAWYDWANKEIERLQSTPENSHSNISSINPGDWITLSRTYAKEHGLGALDGKYKIISKRVKASELFTNGDSLNEFGYWPKTEEASEMYQKNSNNPLGALTTASGQNIISLFEGSDKSTFLHETAHIFLNDLKRVAETYNVQTAEWAKVQEWLGIENGIISRDQHEKFAESFETYLKAGQAPSLELRNAFRTFKKWLVSIYDSIKSGRFGQRDIKVSPEIADVFDRLLATEDEIKAVREHDALIAMLDDSILNGTGFTEAQIAEYRNIVNQAEGSATEKRDKHKFVGREERLAGWKEQAELDARNVPAFGMLESVTDGITKQSIDRYGDSGLDQHSGEWKKSGMDVDVAIAENGQLFGYESAGQFVDDLRKLPPKSLWIAKRIAQLEAEHDNQQDTQEAIRTSSLRRQLEIESEWLAQQADKQAAAEAKQQGREDAAHAKRQSEMEQRWKDAEQKLAIAITEGKMQAEIDKLKASAKKAKADMQAAFKVHQTTSRADMKAWAESTISGRTIRQIGNIGKLLSESRNHRKQAIALARQGKWSEALKENERARLTEELIAASYRAANKWKSMQNNWRKIAKWTNDNKSVKIGSRFRDQINRILSEYGIANREFDPAAPDVHSFAATAIVDDLDGTGASLPSWIGVEVDGFQKLSWSKLQDLDDTLKYLYGNGRDEVNGRKLSSGEAKSEYADGIIARQDGMKELPALKSDATRTGRVLQSIQKSYRKFFAHTGILRYIAKRMDGLGREIGPAEQLVQNIINGMAKSNDMWIEISKEIEPMLAILSKDSNKVFTDLTWPSLLKNEGDSWTKARVVAACLNMGNESNFTKLIEGYGLTENDARELASKLTAEEWMAIQQIWDSVNSLWPQIADVHERLKYYRPKKIDANSVTVTTADGQSLTLRGGYYPIKYDQRFARKIAAWNEKDDILSSHEAIMQVPNAKSGFSKERTGAVYPVDLSLNVLATHLNDTIRFITLSEAVRDADRVFMDEKLMERNLETLGRDMVDMIRPALKVVLRPEASKIGSFFERSRVAMSMYYMGYNAWTAYQNVTGIFPTMYQVGIGNYLAGTKHVMDKPLEMHKAMLEASPYMRLREANIERDLKKQLRNFKIDGMEINGKKYTYDDVKSLGFAGIRVIDGVVALPAWWGKYNAEMEAHGDVQKATEAADAAINKALGSGLAIDSTGIGRHPFMSLLCPFMSFASSQQEELSVQWQAWRNDKISTQEFLYGHFMTWLAPAIMSTFLQGMFMYGLVGAVGGGDDDKNKDAGDYLKDIMSYRLMGIPFARDIYNGVVRRIDGKPASTVRVPALEGFNMVLKFAGDSGAALYGREEKDVKKAMWDAAELASLASGIPATRIYDRWSKGTKQIENGSGWFGNHFIPQERKK